jgi:hypothetical protein
MTTSNEFSAPGPNLVVSTSRFSIEVLGRTGMRYKEGDKSTFIDSEVLAAPAAIALYSRSIKAWDPPHEAVPITDDQLERIVENVRRAFASMNWELDVI